MIEVPDYIKSELGTEPLHEFDIGCDVPAEVASDSVPGGTSESLPTVTVPVPEEAVRPTLYQVNVQGVCYSANNEHLYVISQKGEKTVETLVSSLIVVVADARDGSSNSWGKVVRFCDPDGMEKQLYIRNSDITTNGGAIIKDLVDMGLLVATDRKMVDALLHYLNLAPPIEKERAICSDRIGWHDNVYLLHDNTVIGTSDKRVVYTGAPVCKHIGARGTAEEWKDQVAALCRGNSLLILAVCVAFSSVLLRLLKIESGGYHYFGESSTGKSTTLYVAASVYGEPEPLMGTWRATANGTEGRAKKFNDALMINDELHQSTPKDAGDAAYMIMNGKGKQRANVLGDARDVFEWRLNCLSSGEMAYAAFVQSGGVNSRAGQEVRMVDISADMGLGMGAFENIHGAKDSHSFAERLKKSCSECYGTPIRAFLAAIVSNIDQLQENLADIKERFWDDFIPSDSSGQVQRVATKFAVAALAGEIATVLGLTGWEADEAYQAVGSSFARWLATRGTTGQQEAEQAVEQVQNFLLRHGMSRFAPIDKKDLKLIYPDRQTINQAGFRIINDLANGDRTYEFIVFPETYTREMCAGLNSQYVTQTLIDRGYLELEPNGKPQVRRRLPGMPQARVYHFTSPILADTGEFEENAPEDEAAA
jgi:Superfamily II helicase and inactivated derivatives